MSGFDLKALGKKIAELRIARQLKQTELAYEAGVSHRTLQRLEAGEVVKSDGLLKVIKCLDRLEVMMAALDSSGFSPYEMLADAGLKVSQLDRQRSAPGQPAQREVKPARRKRRVRRAAGAGAEPEPGQSSSDSDKSVHMQWPEDQQ